MFLLAVVISSANCKVFQYIIHSSLLIVFETKCLIIKGMGTIATKQGAVASYSEMT